MKRMLLLMLLTLLFTSSYACCEEDTPHWYMNGAFGYAGYANNNGHAATGRLSLGYIMPVLSILQFGLEGGIQNGNTMRPSFLQDNINYLGGIPVEVQLKPMLDLLATMKTVTLESLPLYSWLKAGLVYQQLHIDRDSINSVKQLSPEVIGGFGLKLNDQASIHLSYQYIWGKQPQLAINPITQSAVLRNIPSRQAIMLGFNFNFL